MDGYYFIGIFTISFFFTFVLILLGKYFNFCCDNIDKEHAVHIVPTPKNGGLAIFIATLSIFFLFNKNIYFIILICAFPVFLYGLYEDFNGNTSQLSRLIIMIICSFILIFFTGYYVNTTGFFKLPKIIGIPFTVFCIVGIASAINFIDGLNGLASGVCIISLSFYALTFYDLHDTLLLYFILAIICAIFGFFIFNYPCGKIFLGDGGAYFLGFIIGFISIILFVKHPEISPWYPLDAFSYPVIETVVTIIRRYYKKKYKGIPFFQSEKLHLHSLLFKRKTRKNHIASFYLLTFHFFINLLAFIFRKNMNILVILFILVIVVYSIWYRNMFIRLNNVYRNK